MREEKIKWLVRGPFKPLLLIGSMAATQGVTQQVAHSMTTQGTIPFWGFSPPVGSFRGGAPYHGKVNVMLASMKMLTDMGHLQYRPRYVKVSHVVNIATGKALWVFLPGCL